MSPSPFLPMIFLGCSSPTPREPRSRSQGTGPVLSVAMGTWPGAALCPLPAGPSFTGAALLHWGLPDRVPCVVSELPTWTPLCHPTCSRPAVTTQGQPAASLGRGLKTGAWAVGCGGLPSGLRPFQVSSGQGLCYSGLSGCTSISASVRSRVYR